MDTGKPSVPAYFATTLCLSLTQATSILALVYPFSLALARLNFLCLNIPTHPLRCLQYQTLWFYRKHRIKTTDYGKHLPCLLMAGIWRQLRGVAQGLKSDHYLSIKTEFHYNRLK